jgi:hypothetical protein
MYHNAAWCFCYEVFLLYIIDYTVKYDQLFSVIKLGVTHRNLSGLPGPNHTPAPVLVLDKKKADKTNHLILWQKCAAMQHARCFVVSLGLAPSS